MKLYKYDEFIKENISYAYAVLRKMNINRDDVIFNKITDKTNKDGYTGLITKLVFIDKIDIEEALDIYDFIKEKGLDVAKLLKLTYEEIQDIVFEFEHTNEIMKVGEINNYIIFYVPSYDLGLTINSPAWCLKTKTNYEYYTKERGGYNFVAILKEFVKGNKTTLPTTNNYFGDSYSNVRRPNVRYGITLYKNNFDYFDDDNKTSNKKDPDLLKIVSVCRDYYIDNLKSDKSNKSEYNQDIIEFVDFIDDKLEDYNRLSFDFKVYELQKYDHIIHELLNEDFNGDSVFNYINNNRYLILQSDLVRKSAVYDMLLYRVFSDIPLSGMLLIERRIEDMWYRYSYGITKCYWGKLYIEQSYPNVDAYLDSLLGLSNGLFFNDINGLDAPEEVTDNYTVINRNKRTITFNYKDFYEENEEEMEDLYIDLDIEEFKNKLLKSVEFFIGDYIINDDYIKVKLK